MKIAQMVESKYLKQSDLEDDTLVTIKKVGQANIAKEGEPVDMKWMIRFEEFDKPMVLNRTNITLLGNFCGEDTDDWIGKQAVLYNDESIQYGGKVTGGLRFKRVKPAPKTPARDAASKRPSVDEDDDFPL